MAKLCQISRVSGSFDRDTLHIISALVMSRLFYCFSVWSNTSARNIDKFQLVRNFACRIITGTKKFEHITPSLREVGWLPVAQQLIYRDSIMTFKCMNAMAPPYLSRLFRKRVAIHDRNTRNKDLLQIPLCKTKSGQRNFQCRATGIWNDMDDELKQLDLKSFKNR